MEGIVSFPDPQLYSINLVLYVQLPHDFLVVYADVEGQIIIGGVILKLFIQQPSWVVISIAGDW